jgi:hypothetical protein
MCSACFENSVVLSSMKKFALIALVVLVVALGGVYLYLDTIVESAIERSSQEALGVNTAVDAATLNLWTGALGMNRFTVQNPSDTAEDVSYFLTLDEGNVQIPRSVLWRDTVRVPEITLADLTVNLNQQGLSSNYEIILQHLSDYLAAGDPSAGPTMSVDDMYLRNITVNLSVSAEALNLSEVATLQATIPALHLQDVGGEESGVSPARLAGIVVVAVLQAVAESEQGLPPVIRDLLLARLDTVPRVPVQVEGEVAWSGAEDVQADIEAALRERADELLDQGERIRDRVHGLLGRDTTDANTQRP